VDVGDAEQFFGAANCLAEAGLCRNVKTGGKQVTGIESIANRQAGDFRRQVVSAPISAARSAAFSSEPKV
jgi:hypothetical protein